jgi:tetratricopeptide (TPR) repeat protein
MRRGLLAVGLFIAACSKNEAPDPKAHADGLYLAGSTEYMKGDLPKAQEHFEHASRLNPQDPRLPAALGEVYFGLGKLDQALLQFQKAAALDPERATNWTRVGMVQMLKGNRAEAQSALDKALKLNPDDPLAHETLAEMALREGKVEEAVQSLLRAAAAVPPEMKTAVYLRAAGELIKRERRTEARAVFDEALEAGVRTPEILTELADLCVQEAKFDQALELYREAAGKSKQDSTLWQVVGELYLRQGKWGDAEAAFRDSLRVKDRAVVHVALGRLALTRKDFSAAKAELDKALAVATGEVRESLELAEFLAALNRKKDALALLATVLDDPPTRENQQLWSQAIRLAQKLGDRDLVRIKCAAAVDAGVSCP